MFACAWRASRRWTTKNRHTPVTTAAAARTASCGEGVFAGLRPAPAQCNVNVNVKSGIPWDGGAVSDCGDAASTSL
ncbi:hypothetical protein C1932_14155 [Stenotrophomonas sp. YAU14D1_LEIMI4_1]|nr:hypothetical protein C1932_14155 [Stenotrophomonas sp. YAU14D1_LEIMI4_1]